MFYPSRDTLHGRRTSTLENYISGHCVCSDNAKIWWLPRRAEEFISASYIAKCYDTSSSVVTETGGTIIMKFKILT